MGSHLKIQLYNICSFSTHFVISSTIINRKKKSLFRITVSKLPTTATNQTTLNEITNKVFNELMQQKTDAQLQCTINGNPSTSMHTLQPPAQNSNHQKRLSDAEDGGGRSDELCSESSSGNFGHLKQPLTKGRTFISAYKQRKFSTTTASSNASVLTSNDVSTDCSSVNGLVTEDASKKPLIARWKTGVRLQNAASPTDSKGKQVNI